jgi:hypothetical protein
MDSVRNGAWLMYLANGHRMISTGPIFFHMTVSHTLIRISCDTFQSRYSNTSHLVQTYYDQQQRDAYAGSGERANLTQKVLIIFT